MKCVRVTFKELNGFALRVVRPGAQTAQGNGRGREQNTEEARG
jgi:hypothetical protein